MAWVEAVYYTYVLFMGAATFVSADWEIGEYNLRVKSKDSFKQDSKHVCPHRPNAVLEFLSKKSKINFIFSGHLLYISNGNTQKLLKVQPVVEVFKGTKNVDSALIMGKDTVLIDGPNVCVYDSDRVLKECSTLSKKYGVKLNKVDFVFHAQDSDYAFVHDNQILMVNLNDRNPSRSISIPLTDFFKELVGKKVFLVIEYPYSDDQRYAVFVDSGEGKGFEDIFIWYFKRDRTAFQVSKWYETDLACSSS